MIDIAAPGENFCTAYYGGQTGGNGPGVRVRRTARPAGPIGIRETSPAPASPRPPWPAVPPCSTTPPNAARFDARRPRRPRHEGRAHELGRQNARLEQRPDRASQRQRRRAHHAGPGQSRRRRPDESQPRVRATVGARPTSLARGKATWATSQPNGWDFGLVAQGRQRLPDHGTILPAGSKINATLDWFRDRTQSARPSFTDASFDNLDLELWEAVGGVRRI